MQGRYGMDKMNSTILIFAGLLYIINFFVRNSILIVVVLLLLALVFFRALSKNINRRVYENSRFTDFLNTVTDFFKRRYMRIRDFRTHRYVRCPYCKAQLRLKKRTGLQHIHCPRCGKDFKKNIWF